MALEVYPFPIGPKLYLTAFVCTPSSQSVDMLPDMLHPAHGPPGSSNANSHYSGRHQAPPLPGVCLLRYGVRFPSRGLVPRIPQSYLTRCFVASSGLAFCPYGISTHMREISIPLPVRERIYLIWNGRMDLIFLLILCIQLASHIFSYLALSTTSSAYGVSGARMRRYRRPRLPNREHHSWRTS